MRPSQFFGDSTSLFLTSNFTVARSVEGAHSPSAIGNNAITTTRSVKYDQIHIQNNDELVSIYLFLSNVKLVKYSTDCVLFSDYSHLYNFMIIYIKNKPNKMHYYYYYLTRQTKWCRTSANNTSGIKHFQRTLNVENLNNWSAWNTYCKLLTNIIIMWNDLKTYIHHRLNEYIIVYSWYILYEN